MTDAEKDNFIYFLASAIELESTDPLIKKFANTISVLATRKLSFLEDNKETIWKDVNEARKIIRSN